MEEKNDLLQIGEQIEKGVIHNRIPISVAIFHLIYLLGKYRVKLDIFSYNSNIDLVIFLLGKVYESEECDLIVYDVALPSLKELNDKFPFAIIDCDADPFTPEDWKVEEHKKGGQLKFDPAKFFLYLSEKQKKGSITGNDLRKELAGKPVMNANVLDYLLAHQELIPEEWKGKYIFFWGTIYRSSDGYLYVRFLSWDGSEWRWNVNWLDFDFRSGYPAILAS